ncbi:hypothetical protein M378DRAFT_168420 [Amanita muscaria Koide BX008]|uniref:Uncharacterized protein n=1 Tax=Amanita muscaria (strain Koide BX008) TaxID=946122 RepID=A0A0C2T130_AMAMK|nr:hypothetical protein M378DRAFT_168420 [Amanita muscaria Koide BX008]
MSVSNDGTYNIFNRANKVYLFIEKDLKASPHPDPWKLEMHGDKVNLIYLKVGWR